MPPQVLMQIGLFPLQTVVLGYKHKHILWVWILIDKLDGDFMEKAKRKIQISMLSK